MVLRILPHTHTHTRTHTHITIKTGGLGAQPPPLIRAECALAIVAIPAQLLPAINHVITPCLPRETNASIIGTHTSFDVSFGGPASGSTLVSLSSCRYTLLGHTYAVTHGHKQRSKYKHLPMFGSQMNRTHAVAMFNMTQS